MKKIYGVAVSVLILAVGIKIFSAQSSSKITNTPENISEKKQEAISKPPELYQASTQTEKTPEITSGFIYRNPDFGFELRLPKDMNDITTKIKPIENEPGYSKITFYLPTQEKKWFQKRHHVNINEGLVEIFYIFVTTRSYFDKTLSCETGTIGMGCKNEWDLLWNQKYGVDFGKSGDLLDINQLPVDVQGRISWITFDYLKTNFKFIKTENHE